MISICCSWVYALANRMLSNTSSPFNPYRCAISATRWGRLIITSRNFLNKVPSVSKKMTICEREKRRYLFHLHHAYEWGFMKRNTCLWEVGLSHREYAQVGSFLCGTRQRSLLYSWFQFLPRVNHLIRSFLLWSWSLSNGCTTCMPTSRICIISLPVQKIPVDFMVFATWMILSIFASLSPLIPTNSFIIIYQLRYLLSCF